MDNKSIIYQLFVRVFGNKVSGTTYNGTLKENGVGKFYDITPNALKKLKKMGITHVWYTGVLDHATTTDYSKISLPANNQSTVKGKAGSPYAIRDYYNVSPDLAIDPANRMEEFENLVVRTHKEGLKVLIDFVPNHVAREYKSISNPIGIKNLGENDDTSKSFAPNNNFYYIPNTCLELPDGNSGYVENPAKATGNNVFTNTPSKNDWYETIKLNYGVDYSNGQSHFTPIPSTWKKMVEILSFWVDKGVDGFRCDMCELVPIEFWKYATSKVKKKNKEIIFIGEAYDPNKYNEFLNNGFDLLYNKVGLYDYLKDIIRNKDDFTNLKRYYHMVDGIQDKMLSFLENHDEERIASTFFANNPLDAIPIMTIASTISNAPVMIYTGQEFGATGMEETGYSGKDGRTSIFDYTYIPELQKWVNGGKFSTELLSEEQKQLYKFYCNLLIATKHEAINNGSFYDLQWVNDNGQSEGFNSYKNFAFMRYVYSKRVLVVSTVDNVAMNAYVKLHPDVFNWSKLKKNKTYTLTDLLTNKKVKTIKGSDFIGDGSAKSGILINMPAKSAFILDIVETEN